MSIDADTEAEVLPPRVEELADGVFAYLQLQGGWGLNNAGFLVGQDAVTLIDTAFTVRRAQAFLEQVRGVTSLPHRTLLNTHHHGDHTYGNFLVEAATIIGHRRARQEMLATGLSTTKLFAPGTDWGDIRIAPPFVVFEDRLDIYVDDLEVQAHFMGPAHTTNDVVYFLPERRLLFAGDLAFNGGTPFVLMGSVAGSLAAYDRLRSWPVDTVVPGHGPVCDPGIFDRMADYLTWLQRVARDAADADVDPLTAALDTDLGRFADWRDPERLVGNLHRAMAEERGGDAGEPLPLPPIIGDMTAYNGGKPLRCLA